MKLFISFLFLEESQITFVFKFVDFQFELKSIKPSRSPSRNRRREILYTGRGGWVKKFWSLSKTLFKLLPLWSILRCLLESSIIVNCDHLISIYQNKLNSENKVRIHIVIESFLTKLPRHPDDESYFLNSF